MLTKKLILTVDKPCYLPGDVVRGQVSVDLQNEIKARSIEVEFHAYEYASVTRGSGKHRHTYVERRDITKQVATVWACAEGETIGPCLDEFPFEFSIPEDALPSLYTPFDFSLPPNASENGIKRTIGSYPYTGNIRYQLKAKVDKPMAIDPKDRTFLDVLPLPVKAREKCWLEHQSITPSGDVAIFASVLGSEFTPGEPVQCSFKVVRSPSVEIRGIAATLRFRYSYTAQRHTDTFSQRMEWLGVPGVSDAGEMTGDFTFHVPEGCLYSVNGELVRIDWELDIKVDIPMKRDNHLRIPITVGPRG